MRVQSACLLLLCAAALSQTYNDFEWKHIFPEKSSKVNCDIMMKNINGNNKCKEINSFIKARVEEIVKLCKDKKNDYITHKCHSIDCKRISQKPCTYKAVGFTGKKKIKCENGLPVHLIITIIIL
uniref:Ribonuclease A-domain domain-containing protein n=1 Tax=Oreochromis aureus TaxID=47969 RepID=A0A668RGD4_OREAU